MAEDMLRTIVLASALALGAATAASACTNQIGDVIFEDNFADDTGGWELYAPTTEIVPPALILRPDASALAVATRNLTFNATEGDYCVTFTLPPAPEGTGNFMGIGLRFWMIDENDLMNFTAYTDQTTYLVKRQGGNAVNVFQEADVDAINVEPGAVNSLRVLAIDSKVTLWINDVEIKTIRAQMPEGLMRFGLFGSIGIAVEPPPAVTVHSFRVTTGR